MSLAGRYDLRLTKYFCKRCGMPIDVESDCFYWFSGPDDPEFWCSNCQDFPNAEYHGMPAEELPKGLQLPKGFLFHIVPHNIPPDDASAGLYRPYTKRTFLRQYLDWVGGRTALTGCQLASTIAVFQRFDAVAQDYTNGIETEMVDRCSNEPCQFLQERALSPQAVRCSLLKLLCDVKGQWGLCETGDEAMILQWYLLLTGATHYPMLIPQASLLSGKRRPDFVCYVPLSRFQYQPVVVLVDRVGKDPHHMKSEDDDYKESRFLVKRITVDDRGSYFKAARELKNWLESL